jgi:hypothetical protein
VNGKKGVKGKTEGRRRKGRGRTVVRHERDLVEAAGEDGPALNLLTEVEVSQSKIDKEERGKRTRMMKTEATITTHPPHLPAGFLNLNSSTLLPCFFHAALNLTLATPMQNQLSWFETPTRLLNQSKIWLAPLGRNEAPKQRRETEATVRTAT